MLQGPNITLDSRVREQAINEWLPSLKTTKFAKLPHMNEDRLSLMSEVAFLQSVDEQKTQQLFESTLGNYGVTTLGSLSGLGNASHGTTLGDQGSFYSGTTGSGDKWGAPFAIAMQVAAKTIGFDLVENIPITQPYGMITYVDFVYADGKISGEGSDAPKVFQIAMPSGFTATKGAYFIASTQASLSTGGELTSNSGAAALQYVGKTRHEGYAIFKLLTLGTASGNVITETETVSLADVFDGTAKVVAGTNATTANTDSTIYSVTSQASFVKAIENNIYGYANGAGGQDAVEYADNWANPTALFEGADRGELESTVSLNMDTVIYHKYISTNGFKVSISMTNEQLQDMKRQHNWDMIAKGETKLIDELSQNINRNILSRLFALGWSNHVNLYNVEGVTLNMSLDPAYTSGSSTYTHVLASGASTQALTIPAYQAFSPSGAAFENLETTQRRIVSKIDYASNIINQRGRYGSATHLVTNATIVSALKNASTYTFTPYSNTLSQSNGALYPAGKVNGLEVYCDPNMSLADTRICVIRKGAQGDPGLKFMPYLLGETVQTIASSTMAPKIQATSRYALVDYGQLPETQYLTFYVDIPAGGIN